MLIQDFISTAIQQIRGAVDEFNSKNEKVKAQMPHEIDFDLAITVSSGIPEVMELGKETKDSHRIKIKVNPLTYPGQEKKMDAARFLHMTCKNCHEIEIIFEKNAKDWECGPCKWDNKEKKEESKFELYATIPCKNCHEKWSVGSKVSVKFKYCPFCNKAL